MQTIKGINDQIRNNQVRIDAENKSAQAERAKADSLHVGGEPGQAQAHATAALQFEERARQLQEKNAALVKEQQAVQAQITQLEQQKAQVVAQEEDQVAQLDAQITKLRGM